MSTEERLKLFIQVCKAVQHAHQKGIIHRDIKPSNVLVTLHDGVPVPKVIDFGIAKATNEQRLTDKTIYTAFEQFMGTPAYMSPEQAEMSGLDIDTRSDIYSLGVLLYELLTGRTPFDPTTLLRAGIDQMRRIIREQEPARPSTSLNTLTQADLTLVANHRRVHPPQLRQAIEGDLDWIVMKLLEKDRTRRYDSATGVAADIQRHLDNEPVVARPPSQMYRIRKMLRRNKMAVAVATIMLLLVVIGLSVSIWLLHNEKMDLQRALAAEKAQNRAQQELEATQFSDQGDNFYGSAIDQNSSVISAEDAFKAEQLYRKSLAIRKTLFGTNDARVLDSLTNLVSVLTYRTNTKENEKELAGFHQEQLGIVRVLSGEESQDTADILGIVASDYSAAGQAEQAENAYRQEIDILKKLPDSDSAQIDPLISITRKFTEEGKMVEAVSYFREAISIEHSLNTNKFIENITQISKAGQRLAARLAADGRLNDAEGVCRNLDDLLLGANSMMEGLPATNDLDFGGQQVDPRTGLPSPVDSATGFSRGFPWGDYITNLRNLASVQKTENKAAESAASLQAADEIEKNIILNLSNKSFDQWQESGLVDYLQTPHPEEGSEELFKSALLVNTNQTDIETILGARGDFYARSRRYDEAKKDYDQVVNLAGNLVNNQYCQYFQVSLALLAFEVGDLETFDACNVMLIESGETSRHMVDFTTACNCKGPLVSLLDKSFLPVGNLEITASLSFLATVLLHETNGYLAVNYTNADIDSATDINPSYIFDAAALAEYRQHNFSDALTFATKAKECAAEPISLAILALTQFGAGNISGAKASLSEGEAADIDDDRPWDDHLIGHILLQEARSLFEPQDSATKQPSQASQAARIRRQADLYLTRGVWFAGAKRYKEAAEDFSKAGEFYFPKTGGIYYDCFASDYALLLLENGDLDGYRKYAHHDGNIPDDLFNSNRNCIFISLLGSNPVVNSETEAHLAYIATNEIQENGGYIPRDIPTNSIQRVSYFDINYTSRILEEAALSAYRQNDFASALHLGEKAIKIQDQSTAYAIYSLAQFKMRQFSEAAGSLARGEMLEKTDNRFWDDQLIGHILLREARSLIRPAAAN